MTLNVSVKDAASLMEVGEMFVRMGLRKQRLPIGSAVLVNDNSERWRYHISAGLLAKYLGITIPELEKMLEALNG